MSALNTRLSNLGTAAWRRSPGRRLGRVAYLIPPLLAVLVVVGVQLSNSGNSPAAPGNPVLSDGGVTDLLPQTEISSLGVVDTSDIDGRINFWKQRTQVHGASDDDWVALGDVFDLRGRMTGDISSYLAATQAYQTAVGMAANNSAAHSGSAREMATLHDFVGALNEATTTIDLNPNALGALGVAHVDETAEPDGQSRCSGAAARQRLEQEVRRLHRRVGSDVREPVIESCRAIDRVEPRHEIHEARQRGQAAEPAAAAAQNPEVEARAKDIDARRVGVEELDRRFRQHERDVALEPVLQPLALVCNRIVRRAQIDENVVAADRDREATQLVRELIEGTARPEIEAGVMPMAREDPVADRAAMEREPHVRTAVVDCIHLIAVREQADRVPIDVDDETSRRAQLGKRRRADEAFSGNKRHALLPFPGLRETFTRTA